MLDGAETTIIGVLPPDFELLTLETADVVLPQKLKRGSERQRLVRALAGLPHGMSASGAIALVMPLFRRFLDSAPNDFRKATGMRLRIEPLKEHQMRE